MTLPIPSEPAFSPAAAAVAALFATTSAAQSGLLPPPAAALPAGGDAQLTGPQAAMVVGEPIPVIWGRRRGTGGGVLVFPRATEARFENDATTVSSRYHLVLGEGPLPPIQRRDVRCGECRIGTFSQNYSRRAGTWVPGNFAVAATGYQVPSFPTWTGGGGNYQGLATLEAGATFPGGSDGWQTGWNVFLRGGLIVERGRLLDGVVGPSDNLADLILWALQQSKRCPEPMIDLPSLTAAARFLEVNGLWCNGEFSTSGNLGDWLIKILPDFLLRETRIGGRFGLRPLLPVNSDGTINTAPIAPDWVLTEAAIVPESWEVNYSDAASLRPAAMAMLWRQQFDDTDIPIPRTLTVGNQNASGPVEQHDLSQYATTENHVAKVGAYLYARRTLSTHTATVKLRPGTQTGNIKEGDIVQIYLQVVTNREPDSVYNKYYQVESVGHALSGEETLSFSHFPVDSTGRSLIALAVASAKGTGEILPSNRSGSCDLPGASADTSVPEASTSGDPFDEPGLDDTYWAAGGTTIRGGVSDGTAGGPGGAGSTAGVTYSAAGRQLIDLFNGWPTQPVDAPPPPSGAPIAHGGGPLAPSDGTNSAGGDSRCPYGYNRVGGYIDSGMITGGDSFRSRTDYFAATDFPRIARSAADYTFQNWLVETWTVSWVGWDSMEQTGSPTFRSVEVTSLISQNPAIPNAILEVSATGYSCILENGSAGPLVSRPAGPVIYVVKENDSMASISQKMYGTPSRAADIQAANAWLMGLDNWGLWPGLKLTIPT